jgi:hypothetical protein
MKKLVREQIDNYPQHIEYSQAYAICDTSNKNALRRGFPNLRGPEDSVYVGHCTLSQSRAELYIGQVGESTITMSDPESARSPIRLLFFTQPQLLAGLMADIRRFGDIVGVSLPLPRRRA